MRCCAGHHDCRPHHRRIKEHLKSGFGRPRIVIGLWYSLFLITSSRIKTARQAIPCHFRHFPITYNLLHARPQCTLLLRLCLRWSLSIPEELLPARPVHQSRRVRPNRQTLPSSALSGCTRQRAVTKIPTPLFPGAAFENVDLFEVVFERSWSASRKRGSQSRDAPS